MEGVDVLRHAGAILIPESHDLSEDRYPVHDVFILEHYAYLLLKDICLVFSLKLLYRLMSIKHLTYVAAFICNTSQVDASILSGLLSPYCTSI